MADKQERCINDVRSETMRKRKKDTFYLIAGCWLLCMGFGIGALWHIMTTAKTNIPVETPYVATWSRQGTTVNESTPQTIDEYIETYCGLYDVDTELVRAVMMVESGGQTEAVNGSCVGLMQLNTEYSQYYMDGAGITDLYDTEQNLKAGIWHLSVLQDRYYSTNMVLMAYNCGEVRAQELWLEGIFETEYTRRVGELLNG